MNLNSNSVTRTIFLLFIALFLQPIVLLAQTEKGLDDRINEAFKPISDFFSQLVFFELGGNPFVIYLLVGGAVFFTLFTNRIPS